MEKRTVIARRKIALIGAGQIGGTLALLAGMRNVGDVVLYDVVEDMPQGKALDLAHLAPVFGYDFVVKGTNEMSDIQGADVCIVTSGLPRKPGMSRDDLVRTNAEIVRKVGEGIKTYAPNSLIIVVTNPLDAMAWLMQKVTGFPPERVLGMAGVLDTARYQAFLAEELGVSVSSVSAFVLGGHGDDMVPVRSYTTCGGIPVDRLISAERLDAIEKRVRGAGGEVVALLKTGSAFFSPAASAMLMAEAYLFDKQKVLPAAALCRGEYGVEGVYLGVPIIMGKKGVERIIEIELSAEEKRALHESADRVRGLISLLDANV
jgi:malate dehydrogenase